MVRVSAGVFGGLRFNSDLKSKHVQAQRNPLFGPTGWICPVQWQNIRYESTIGTVVVIPLFPTGIAASGYG